MAEPLNAFEQRHLEMGREWDRLMAIGSLERCNCMVRYSNGPQTPAIRKGKHFTTPEGESIVPPDSFEDMRYQDIIRAMKCRNEIYIGHVFK